MTGTLHKSRRTATLASVTNHYRARNAAVPRRRKEIPSDVTDLRQRFARRLRALMAKRGWSSKDVARMLTAAGVPMGPRGIDAWLRCATAPRFSELETIGQALGYQDYRDLLPPPK